MNIHFILNGGTANRGCEAILLSTYDIIKAAVPSARFVNGSARDDRIKRARYLDLPNMRHACHPRPLSMRGLRWQFDKRVVGRRFYFEHRLADADVLLSLGGDNYTLDYGSAAYYLSANARVLDAGKRLILWGASIGPFDKKPAIERWAAEQLKQVHGIVVRETRTRDYLAGLGVTENVILMPDPAFALAPERVELPRDIERMLTAGAIGLNLSPLLARYRPFPPEWPREAAQWIETLLAAVDAPFLLIPHVIYPGTANPDNNDAAFLAKVMRLTRAKPGQLQLLHGDNLSSRQIKYVISRLKAFVGARTHATIASLSSSVPTLSIGYSVKARGINEDLFGHERWLIDHLTVNPQLLAAKLRELLSEAEAVRAHLKSRNATYRVDYRAVRALLS